MRPNPPYAQPPPLAPLRCPASCVYPVRSQNMLDRALGRLKDPETGQIYHDTHCPPPDDQELRSRLCRVKNIDASRVSQLYDECVLNARKCETVARLLQIRKLFLTVRAATCPRLRPFDIVSKALTMNSMGTGAHALCQSCGGLRGGYACVPPCWLFHFDGVGLRPLSSTISVG